MIGRALVMMIGVVAVGGCKGERHDTPSWAPGSSSSPLVVVDASTASAFATAIAPPLPFDRFRPHMSHADFVTTVADAGLVASRSSMPSELGVPADETVYKTALPNTYAYFSFGSDDRLEGLTIVGGNESALEQEVIAHWGQGEQLDSPHDEGLRVFSAPQSGWQISLDVRTSTPILKFSASRSQADPAVAKPNPKLWSDLGGLIGSPLAAAKPLFGAALELSDQRPGAVRIATAWDDLPWELSFTVDRATTKVTRVTATGGTDSEDARIALISSLSTAFGVPHTTISDAGRIEIACTTKTLEVRLGDSADEWTISIQAR